MTSGAEERPRLITGGYEQHRSQWVYKKLKNLNLAEFWAFLSLVGKAFSNVAQKDPCFKKLGHMINPLTPGNICQNCVFWHFGGFEIGSRSCISFSVVENAFATQQLAVLATGIAFRTFWPRYAKKFWLKVTYGLRLFDFWNVFFSPFFSFGFLFAAVSDFLLGLLGVKKCLRRSYLGGQFLPWSS